jgi:5'-nucleotidase
MNRRLFLQHIAGVSGAVALGSWPLESWADNAATDLKITILHTNDQHSRLEPFPKTDRLAGRGGVVNRARILSKIRAEEANVLLFDAGDIFQGTPYFNFYKGRPEIELMSQMGYDAVTMGNHDFDGGLDLYVKQIKEHAKFSVLVANYDFSNTVMEGLAQPYKIFKIKGVRIGVFGLGINPQGLIPEKLFGGTKYLDPVKVANETAAMLRNEKKCSLVVCLSHLGYRMSGGEMSDLLLAPQTQHIDLIIGGHTHTFLNEPTLVKNQVGKPVIINQAGWGGASLGRLDFTFDRISKKVFFQSQAVSVNS